MMVMELSPHLHAATMGGDTDQPPDLYDPETQRAIHVRHVVWLMDMMADTMPAASLAVREQRLLEPGALNVPARLARLSFFVDLLNEAARTFRADERVTFGVRPAQQDVIVEVLRNGAEDEFFGQLDEVWTEYLMDDSFFTSGDDMSEDDSPSESD